MTADCSVPDSAYWMRRVRSLARLRSGRPRAIIALPAKDEALHLIPCLTALSEQRDLHGNKIEGGEFGVVLLLNNCSDISPKVAARCAERLPYNLWIEERQLPSHQANAGFARRLAMDAAAAWLTVVGRKDGFILTTDADTRVAPDWIARQEKAFGDSIDAVAGCVIEDPEEYQHLPLSLRRRGELEERYTRLLIELESLVDPVSWDPWPRHGMASGASLGVTLDWYSRIGGLPLRACGEDRALLQRLAAAGARVRHCLKTRVITSCRLEGRAAGGMAETMAARIADPDALTAFRRMVWRTTSQKWHAGERDLESISAFGLPPDVLAKAVATSDFWTFWETLLREESQLVGRRLQPIELPGQIRHAQQIIHALRATSPLARLSPPVCEAHLTDIALPALRDAARGRAELSG
jgi:hypothetical protein